jgi:signal transduction histidine kinase
VIELSRYVLETLRKDEELILYRGRSRGDPGQVLVLSPVTEYPKSETLKRLEHECSLREALRDSGPGLDSTQLTRVFEPFYTTKSQGTGMGLAISRSIIEAHDGRLWVTANAPQGAVFQFTLPCIPA